MQFPRPEAVSSVSETVLRQLGLGYRAPYLHKTAQRVQSDPKMLDRIRQMDYEEAKEELLGLPGIGPKVADCVLLYGFGQFRAFPLDVWMHRAMRKLYFRNRKVQPPRIVHYAQRKWGDLAGYVQQYIFHAVRTRVITVC